VPVAPGSKLGPYEILALLGAGGMGEVYRARDLRLGREVAIKVLPAERMADADRRRRFVQEARAASALNHPNIVTIHEIGSVDGIDFIVMEYVRGKTLDLVIPAQGMRLPQVLRIAIPMADALARAHAAGIVHRDVKPSNVAVSDEGVVKVLDFGLAKLAAEPKDTGPKDETQTEDGGHDALSRPGARAGTVGYMSPEQATGGEVDARSDVFSFGTVLYEMVTGRRAFAGGSGPETQAALVSDEPRAPSEVVAGVPKELDRLILRCLKKERNRRYQNMLDVKVELQEIKEESESGTAGPRSVPSRRRWWLAAGVALAVALALAVAAWRVAVPKATLPPPWVVQLTSMRGFARNPTFSPDGEQLAFAWRGEKQDNWDVYVKLVDAPEVRRLTTDGASDVSPSWSPDGRQIAYLRLPADQAPSEPGPATIHLVSPLGGSDRRLSDFPTAASWYGVLAASWTPDSRWLAVTRFESTSKAHLGGIFLVPVQGGDPRALTSPKAPGENHANASFSPDGRHLAYLSCLAWFQCHLEVADVGPDFVPSGSPRGLITRALCLPAHPSWTRDGRFIIYSSCADDMLWRIAIAGDHPAERIEVAGFHAIWPTTAASRDRVAFQHELLGASDVYRFEGGRPPQPVLASSMADCCSSLSPDGRRVVFASTRSSEGAIWVADADFSNAVPLTTGLAGGMPRWSPDGLRIVFDARDNDGHYHIWTVEAEGGSPRQLTKGPGDENRPSWSRDGRYVYFAATRRGGSDVVRIAATGGAEEPITHNGGQLPIESIDGRTLYFKRGDLTAVEAPLFALPLGGGPERQLVECVREFDVGNGGIYHLGCAEDSAGRSLYLLDPVTGASRLLAKLERATGSLTVSRDGKTILYPRLKDDSSDLMMIENFR
jgi:Tol biopolymer transport system component